MEELDKVDIKENYIYQIEKKLLEILLKDHSSNKNIIWATDNYQLKGNGYFFKDQITVKNITGRNGQIIRPRIKKSLKEQAKRIKDKAEVFTPSWICNEMANHFDNAWFEKENVFNTENDKIWIPNSKKIEFPSTEGKTWKDYVGLRVLEISCGEAPFLVSRYDTVTGEWLEINQRIGLLDRKLRIINENVDHEKEWVETVIEAYKSTYGYEWQGDSLLIARENLLFTFIDYYFEKFGIYPISDYLIEIAKIISWNIWQMDGLKYVIPESCKSVPKLQMSLFDEENELEECPGCVNNNNNRHTGVYCKVMNWATKRSIKFFKGEKKMKFDFVIGNPPYQESDGGGTGDSAKPIYQLFIKNAKEITKVSFSLIVPSRWMKGGKGLESFRQEMIDDTRIKSISDYEDASECFPGVHIDGGVCFIVWQNNYCGEVSFKYKPKNEEAIFSKRFLKTDFANTVIRDYRQSSIIKKTSKTQKFSEIVSYRNPYGLSADLFNETEKYKNLSISFDEQGDKLKIFGVQGKKGGAKRVVGFIDANKIEKNISNVNKYKLFFSKAYMTTSTVPPEIIIGTPNCICTETFLEIGAFNNIQETNNCLNYIRTKFFRALLFYNRHSLNISKESFSLIPLQDFTKKSDIDWSKSIHEIDLQLYKKYGLSEEEIAFIESHIKEMK